MAYCVVADVFALNASRNHAAVYDTTSIPTATQVQAFIDGIAGELDSVLASNNRLTPVTTPASFVAYLKRLNALGAAAQAEAAQFPEFDASTPMATPQSQRYWAWYQIGLKSLKDESGIDPNAPISGTTSFAETYLSDNPENQGPNEADGFTGQGYGNQEQPVFGMQKVF